MMRKFHRWGGQAIDLREAVSVRYEHTVPVIHHVVGGRCRGR